MSEPGPLFVNDRGCKSYWFRSFIKNHVLCLVLDGNGRGEQELQIFWFLSHSTQWPHKPVVHISCSLRISTILRNGRFLWWPRGNLCMSVFFTRVGQVEVLCKVSSLKAWGGASFARGASLAWGKGHRNISFFKLLSLVCIRIVGLFLV